MSIDRDIPPEFSPYHRQIALKEGESAPCAPPETVSNPVGRETAQHEPQPGRAAPFGER